MMKRIGFALIPLLALCGAPAGAQSTADEVTAKDTGWDDGSSITVRWEPVDNATEYRIERAPEEGEFEVIGTADAEDTSFSDTVERGVPFRYRVISVGPTGFESVSTATDWVRARAQWFRIELLGVAFACLAFAGVVVWFIARARRGEKLFLRRIAGLDAVEEAVGRATEMGREVLYIPGIGYISDIATVASMNILGEVAKKTAQYGTRINVPNRDPVVYTVAREVVKNAYTEAGVPDAYDPNSVHFVVEYSLAYAAAVSGIMVRQKPATNLFLGYFAAESLILAETGATTGAIQIAGTDQVTQLPFFVVACDYTLMGEELYAASAYLSRDPLMVGALKGQDIGKFIFLVLLTAGSLASLIFGIDVGWVLSTSGY